MKKLFLLSIIIICNLVVKSQTINYDLRIDSLKNEILYTNKKIDDVKYNLRLCDKQFQTGTYIYAGGILCSVAGIAIKDQEGNINLPLLVVGGIAQLVGIVTMWQSHSYIGEAGKK